MSQVIRVLLVGAPGSEFRLAAELARSAGAEVTMADDIAQSLAQLRQGGGDLSLIDVGFDVGAYIGALRAERFAIPVLACGIDAPAERAVAAIRAGARDYLPLPPQRELIAAAIASVVERRDQTMLGSDPVLLRAQALGRAVARSHAPVLVAGEAGVGKGMMARDIHQASGRPGAMQIVECAGVSAEVLESELFGHEAGAFPGAANRRIGRLEQAGEGSVLLREVGALPSPIQARLSTALQEHRIRRVGGDVPVPMSARVIASTTVDLAALVGIGGFRADLLARLGLVRIEVPPLRERAGDIVPLAAHFAQHFAAEDGIAPRPLSDEALALLQRHRWPGNVRELADMVHRAVLLADGYDIGPENLVLSDGTLLIAEPAPEQFEVGALVGRSVEEVERELILQTLERCQGNRTSASNILGISVRTMRNKLRTYIEAGIPVAPAL